PSKAFLYDVVNNVRSGVDVDKLDYFQCDMQTTHASTPNINFERYEAAANCVRTVESLSGANIMSLAVLFCCLFACLLVQLHRVGSRAESRGRRRRHHFAHGALAAFAPRR